ncbi:hypothetical protein LWI28_023788 [Acer negundo]|uniref:Uncharacterized protein n=1 Tax=Acer negundo TaxID=4023 RepID=A0AAD5JH08_ACENE|nr:hypothetical protein LWI28_023788 [Acer negundo]
MRTDFPDEEESAGWNMFFDGASNQKEGLRNRGSSRKLLLQCGVSHHGEKEEEDLFKPKARFQSCNAKRVSATVGNINRGTCPFAYSTLSSPLGNAIDQLKNNTSSNSFFPFFSVGLEKELVLEPAERSRPDSGFIDRVAGQRPKERDQSHSSGSPLVRRLTVILESDQGSENSIQDRKQLMISVTMT